jgi:hypothetical protein
MKKLYSLTLLISLFFFACSEPDVLDPVKDAGSSADLVADAGCLPSCADKQCGDDGCGGICGSCAEESPFCNDGTCSSDCTPVCFGKECGDDGCGGTCGECPESAQYCVKGACSSIQCQPQCLGKDCGDDGCGGNCGECPSANHTCQSGICIDPCGGVTYHGCCEGDTIQWCFDKKLMQLDCSTNTGSGDLKCGWSPEKLDGVYDCVPEAGEDPSGTHSSSCP